MNRVEFMSKLAYLLQELPFDEREEALQYYNDYFDDAGDENEPALLKELESPEKVAAIIKDGLKEDAKEAGEFNEKGFEDERYTEKQELDRRTYLEKRIDFRKKKETGYRYRNNQNYNGGNNNSYQKQEQYNQGHNKNVRILLIIVLCIFAIPIGIPLLIAAVATIFGLLLAAVAVVFSLVVAAGAVCISGVVVFIAGIGELFISAPAGLVISGVGLVLFALGLVFVILTGALCIKVIPGIIKWFVRMCRIPFDRREKRRYEKGV